jgi:hypothetical protein
LTRGIVGGKISQQLLVEESHCGINRLQRGDTAACAEVAENPHYFTRNRWETRITARQKVMKPKAMASRNARPMKGDGTFGSHRGSKDLGFDSQ